MQIDVAWDLTYNEISFMSEMGETMRVDEVMTEIIQRCRLYGAQKIILYGSRAKGDRKSTRLNSSHNRESRMPSSA